MGSVYSGPGFGAAKRKGGFGVPVLSWGAVQQHQAAAEGCHVPG